MFIKLVQFFKALAFAPLVIARDAARLKALANKQNSRQ